MPHFDLKALCRFWVLSPNNYWAVSVRNKQEIVPFFWKHDVSFVHRITTRHSGKLPK